MTAIFLLTVCKTGSIKFAVLIIFLSNEKDRIMSDFVKKT